LNFMKNNKNIFGSLILALVLLAACRDDSKIIYDTSKLPTGAYVRLLSQPPSDVDPTTTTFDGTAFPFTAEVVGVSSPSDITSFDVKVRLIDKDAKVLKPYVALGSITTFAVSTTGSQLPQGTASFAGSAIRTALSLTGSDLIAGNQLEFSTSLKLKDGRTYDASNFDPNMANTFYGAAYEYISSISDPAPAPTLSWRNGNSNKSKSVPLMNGKADTLDIVFSKAIATLPTISASLSYFSFSSVVYNNADKKDSKKKYYVIATGTASGTGSVKITVSGAVASDGNTMATASNTRAADNQAPVASLSWSKDAIGRGQNATLTLSFNEAMGAAPKVTISGQNQDGVTNASMTLSDDGLSATLLYGYKNSNAVDNTTSGNLTVTLSGGTDLAGNALQAGLLSSTDLATDVAQPGLPTVTPDGSQYDWGTQLKLAASVSGYGDGTIYYVAVAHNATAPTQATGTVSGVTVKAGFDTTGVTVVASGSFNLNDTFVPFTANGNLDLYFYFVSTTGNVSANTTSPVNINMQ
jgi:hypothetical protein